MEAVDSIELTAPGVASLVLRDLSQYATLPFLAAFDVQAAPSPSATSSTSRPPRTAAHRVTYIALSKKAMPLLVDHFLRFKEDATIYADGTIEALFAVRSRHQPAGFCPLLTTLKGIFDTYQAEV